MPGYHPQDFEKNWQQFWLTNKTFQAIGPEAGGGAKPKYYVLDMFPYPSGAGLHVGHPLGYIASDIVARYKRHQGYNVLHPMGFDSFGLPAEQYAIQTGQHPAKTTDDNIKTYIRQLQSLGFSYDWGREVRTSDPSYYKWTQWIFLQLFNSWYDLTLDRARPLRELTEAFAQGGSEAVRAAGDVADQPVFTAGQWQTFSEKQRLDAVAPYRLAYQTETYVNWCPVLSTVLSNDEVKDGVSERGGYPVERRLMLQWMMRITAYADRLLGGLDGLDWPDAVKEMQRNWIGRSVGASVRFRVMMTDVGHAWSANFEQPEEIEVFTTRVDTIYGATFLVLAPENPLTLTLGERAYRMGEGHPLSAEIWENLQGYVEQARNRSERDRQTDVKTVSGAFTGFYARNPFTGQDIEVWTADYVLAGYGTGAVMAVPSGDQRDWLFATHFKLPIVAVTDAQQHLDQQADPTKEGRYLSHDFQPAKVDLIGGLPYAEATATLLTYLQAHNLGEAKVTYRLRDAIFGRQRYWGEPLPIYYAADGTARGVAETDLPLVLPEIDAYKPTETGEPPLGRATNWKYAKGNQQFPFELSTMPGWAGSSWYYLRYMDPTNPDRFVGEAAEKYWGEVDFYFGGAEHATGHLLYARFWYLFLKDHGLVSGEEPFRKLLNQGMILGRSNFVYRINGTNRFVSHSRKNQFDTTALHVDVNLTENDVLDTERFRAWRPEYADAEFVLETDGAHAGQYVCGVEIEKMSKSKHNVVSPDELVQRAGADALRCYEMFLGPLEQFKPWNTSGLSGVSTFLRRFWRLFHPEDGDFALTDEAPTREELKILHGTIKKVREDVERLSFNTVVSALMIATNELTALNCHKRAVLAPLVVVVEPYAPHLAEELWAKLGHPAGTASTAPWPAVEEQYLVADEVTYPLAINGKVRSEQVFAATATAAEIEAAVRASDFLPRYAEGKTPKKIIVVPGRMVNVVV